MIGTVKRWVADRGYGFLQPETGGESIFAHISQVNDDELDDLPEGARVTFDIGPGRNDRTEAKNIEIEGNR